MPKESTTTKAVDTEITAPTSSTAREVETSGDRTTVTRTENLVPASIEDMNMMDYVSARNKIPIHN